MRVKSNRESGHGRSDLVVALKQIEESDYAAYWDDEGYVDIMKYGIAFY